MKYKVCILAAGVGSRMLPTTSKINKALLPINFKAAISHIIEKFDNSIEIVIAVGYEKKKLIEYIQCAHPNRLITFVNVDKFSGKGSGPGYSLLRCKSKLNTPFIFFSVDTIVSNKIPMPDCNWMGVSQIDEPKNYCTVSIKNSFVNGLEDKIKSKNKYAFIGLAGIYDYKTFFKFLKQDKKLIQKEIQVSNGFKGLIQKKIKVKKFNWYDIGNLQGYFNLKFKQNKKELFNFEKSNEYLYFVDNRVIKYFEDKDIVKKRILRSKKLKDLTPKLDIYKKHFYSYKKLPGCTLYDIRSIKIIDELFLFLQERLWKKRNLDKLQKEEFKKACKSFYYVKTLKRLDDYFKTNNIQDKNYSINNEKIDTVKNLLKKVKWESLFEGMPSQFHGDLQFENILFTNNSFKLIDWRQDFGGLTNYGDLYYDLAKLNGGLYVSYMKIKKNKFKYQQKNNKIFIDHDKDNFLNNVKKKFDKFVFDNNYDLLKIETLTGIIFLNMSAMHQSPFNHFIFNLGRQKLQSALKNISK